MHRNPGLRAQDSSDISREFLETRLREGAVGVKILPAPWTHGGVKKPAYQRAPSKHDRKGQRGAIATYRAFAVPQALDYLMYTNRRFVSFAAVFGFWSERVVS